MNPEASLPDSNEPPLIPDESPAVEWARDGEFADPFNWRQWLRRFLVCNPFFLASAALLLFALNRLSVDPNFLQREEAKLLFNFAALQGYEILVVATAVVLARRRIWYDSALLVVVEHGLLIVPFIFITQAALIDRGMAGALSVVAGCMALGRMGSVRRWFPEFRLPNALIALGAVVLAANLVLVFASRQVMETTFENWAGPNEWVWALGLPLLVAAVNLLPKPATRDGAEPERPWLPLLIALLWIAGTAVHVWCVAWICKLPLEARHLAPVLWAALWTGFLRLGDCQWPRSRSAELGLLGAALAAPALASGRPEWLALLMGLNGVAFLAVAWRRPELREPLRHFAAASFSGVVAVSSPHWLGALTGWQPMTGDVPAIGLGCFLVVTAIRLEHPGAGLAAAFVGMVAMMRLDLPGGGHGAVQVGALVLIAHSLRWNDGAHPGAAGLRRVALGLWLLGALVWTREAAWLPVVFTAAGSAGVSLLWFWAGLKGRAVTRMVPGVALGVALSGPANWLQSSGSTGMLALLGSLFLFAAGYVVAVRRSVRNEQP